ncbi:PREDICTED: uncharacterized protein LOC108559060 [Nicrophorus vespilloides]|uniref:Uncharacterized protein LOC108559060 n=1 Tax=Nicrophorus vespilloides TaxID=110193 RepID=A0ABM1MAS6_NICVS|nr:PREDICTED: uncharacterized protein LOC108559060 [Nicrophorus vespilloides]
MELLNIVDPPNRPMNTSFNPTQEPKLHKDLIFIDVDKTEQIVVGSTNTSATFWEGSVQVFKGFNNFIERSWTSYYNGNIINDGKILSKYKSVVIAENPFSLSVLNIGDEQDGSPILKYSQEHLEKIKSINLWDKSPRILTCGEKYLSIWNINENNGLKKIHDYVGYHTADITSSCTQKCDENLFASTGIDRRLIIWDTRMNIGAHVLYTNEFCSLTAVSWNTDTPTTVAVGTEIGDIYFLDTRKPDEFISVKSCFKNSVHKIVYNSTGDLAVCGNCREVQVFNDKYEVIYKNSDHSKFVRGLSWAKGSLYSCGFDTKVYKHKI